MTDIFPAIIAIYPPNIVNNWKSPYETIGISDEGRTIFNDCRVIVHKNRLIVGNDGPRGPQTVFYADTQEVYKDSSSEFLRVLTVNGELAIIGKSKGCGCGSRLRSWNPYGNIISA